MRTRISTVLRATIPLSICLASAIGHAAPGDGPEDDSERHQIRVQGPAQAGERCTTHGGLCTSPGDAGTATAPYQIALAAGTPIIALEAPGFVRVRPADAGRSLDPDALPWTVQVSAAFSHNAAAGNALFVLRDIEDPDQAPATRMVTALWQETIPRGDGIVMKMMLNADDGFRGGHTYELRIVQLIGGKEVDLAAGLVRLL